jgi:hypothetical protein
MHQIAATNVPNASDPTTPSLGARHPLKTTSTHIRADQNSAVQNGALMCPKKKLLAVFHVLPCAVIGKRAARKPLKYLVT